MDRTKFIKIFLEHNFNIATDALDYIVQKNVSEKVLREKILKIPQEIPVVNLSLIKKFFEPTDLPSQSIKSENIVELNKLSQVTNENDKTDRITEKEITEISKDSDKRDTIPAAHRSSSQITVKLDIPERTSAKPDFLAFRKLFQNRFEQLSNIFLENFKSSEPILKRKIEGEEVSKYKSGVLIGMVQDTRVLHTNKFVIQLEDLESEIITNCVMVQDSPSFPEYRDILRDTVIGISGVLPKNFKEGNITAFWGKDVIRPGFFPITFNPTSNPHKILFIADLHYGSKYFSRSIFAKLIKLLTLKDLDSLYVKMAEDIKTIIIVGDLVDGVGRFSNQKEQITSHSFQTQYEGLAKILMDIPSDIQIFVIPGEHDATQAALPQPAIDRQISKSLLVIPNLTSHGNPLRLSLENMNLLIFHGQGTYELFQKQFQKTHLNPTTAIKHLLEYRHLYPEYGSYNPLAPFNKDYLVIDEVPNVIVSGHLHHAYFEEYKGIKIITCGTFQRENQISTQLEGNVSLGIVPILDTQSGKVEMIDLKEL
ncbi:MAG: metallophosphoesterase [Candidatus Thorarchaeota archaeon]